MNMNLLETWRRAAKIETFILGFPYNSFQNVVRVLPSFSDWLRRLDPSYVERGGLEGSKPKAIMKIIQACDYK